MNDFGTIFFQSFLPSLAYQIPVLIVLLIGFIIALARWRKDPFVSLLTVLAIVIVSTITILGTFANSALSLILYYTFGMDYTTIGIIFSVVSVLFNLLTALSWVLLFIALFGKRKTKAAAVEQQSTDSEI